MLFKFSLQIPSELHFTVTKILCIHSPPCMFSNESVCTHPYPPLLYNIESVFGYECEFVDECDEGFVCAVNEVLDYMTCQCPPGHSLSVDGFTCEGICMSTIFIAW